MQPHISSSRAACAISPSAIAAAFRAAREADPNAKLFYNDFWNYLDDKRAFIITIIKKLQAENLIDGVGLQCHLNISVAQEKMDNQTIYQTVENLEKEIQEYAALGLEVHITEMDVSVGSEISPEKLQRQAEIYRDMLSVCMQAENCDTLVVWGATDAYSWLPEKTGTQDAGVLFDVQYQPKPAVETLLERFDSTE